MKTYTIKSNAVRAARAIGLDKANIKSQEDAPGEGSTKGIVRYYIDPDSYNEPWLVTRHNELVRQLTATGYEGHHKERQHFDDLDVGVATCESVWSTLRARQKSNQTTEEAPVESMVDTVASTDTQQQDTAPITESPQEEPNVSTTTIKTKRAKKTNGNGAEKAPKAKTTKEAGAKRGAKMEIIGRLLARKSGCTSKEILEATGWPSVSVPAMSKNLGRKLRKEREQGKPTRYYAEAS